MRGRTRYVTACTNYLIPTVAGIFLRGLVANRPGVNLEYIQQWQYPLH